MGRNDWKIFPGILFLGIMVTGVISIFFNMITGFGRLFPLNNTQVGSFCVGALVGVGLYYILEEL